MQIRLIELTNFRRYKDNIVEFPDGLIGIVGKNGVGKTTLIEALAWCLYGTEAARNGRIGIIRSDAGEKAICQVAVELVLGDDAVRIVRKQGNSGGDAKLFLNGSTNAHVTGVTAVNNYIKTKIGMDHTSFITSVFVRQKELTRLTTETSANRKKIILRLLGINRVKKAI